VAGADIYFVRNPKGSDVKASATFRAGGSAPQLWDAVTGTVSGTPYMAGAGVTTVPLDLPAYGSVFVVFPDGAAALPLAVPVRSEPVALGTSWRVTFQAGRGAPAETAMTELTDWAKSGDAGIRYFSGTAAYTNGFSLPKVPESGLTLALSDLHEIATVKVNGQSAGTIWALPYRLAIPANLLHAGENTLEIDVTNLWPNRIIGDLQPGLTAPVTHTNVRKYTAGSPLLPSGLIGPVTLTAN
jgi:hypothetical protein